MQIQQLVVLASAIALFIAGFRLARTHLARRPGRRAVIMLCSAAAVTVVVVLAPRAAKLTGSWAESPAGIYLLLVRFVPLLVVGLMALGAFFGAAFPSRPHATTDTSGS